MGGQVLDDNVRRDPVESAALEKHGFVESGIGNDAVRSVD
jgi:hypothetical protein